LVAADGGIFNYGDAPFEGSAGAMTLNAPVVGMAATSTGKGYWLVAADGGIFTYGDAVFHGSAGGMTLAKPIVGMAATVDDGGYWLVGADGGIFTYGDAVYLGNGLASACSLGVPEECVLGGNACTSYQATAACASGQACQHGTCQGTCTDACTTGASRCSGTNLEVCGHYGDVPCNTWSTAAACPTGQTCMNNVCASEACADDCESGGVQCADAGLETCTAETDGGCLTWGAATPCQAGATCTADGCTKAIAAEVDAGPGLPDAGAAGGEGGVVDASVLTDAAKKGGGSAPPATTSGSSGSGCGCAVAGASPVRGPSPWLLGVMGLGLLRRRRNGHHARRAPTRCPCCAPLSSDSRWV
jgi:MYXO-CTERM domain-containing protein